MHFVASTHSRRKLLLLDNQLPPPFHPDGAPARAIVTLRISPRPQPGELSLEKQEMETVEWCERRRMTVVAIYIDDKISGRNRKKRRAFNAALEHAKEIKAVLVGHSLSRFARSIRDMLAINDELSSVGLSFAVATGPPVDTTTASGRLMLNMWASIHQYFAEFHAEQTRDALRWRKANGLVYCHRTPFGWGKNGHRLAPIDREQRIIRWSIWRLRLGFTPGRLFKELTARGFHGREERKITHQMIRQVEQGWKDGRLQVSEGPHPLDVADLHIARMDEAGTLRSYLKARWSRPTRIVIVPRGLIVDRWGRWPHKRSWLSVVDRPIMDDEGYLLVSLDELRDIRRRTYDPNRRVWPQLPEDPALLEPLCIKRPQPALTASPALHC